MPIFILKGIKSDMPEEQEKKEVVSPYREYLKQMEASSGDPNEEQIERKRLNKANQNRLERIAFAVEVLAMKAMGVVSNLDYNGQYVLKKIMKARTLQELLNGETFEELALLEETEEAPEPAAEEGV